MGHTDPTAFGSTRRLTAPRRYVTVRTLGPAPELGSQLRAAIAEVDPTIPVVRIQAIDELVSERTARQRLVMLVLLVFGTVANTLCALGLYAVVSLTSRQRRREYAIRVAMGAPRSGVGWMVLRQALRLGAVGMLAGLGAAALGTRTLQGLLHGVQPLDPLTFVVAAAGVLALAVVAAWMPARQAARVDPVETLRAD